MYLCLINSSRRVVEPALVLRDCFGWHYRLLPPPPPEPQFIQHLLNLHFTEVAKACELGFLQVLLKALNRSLEIITLVIRVFKLCGKKYSGNIFAWDMAKLMRV